MHLLLACVTFEATAIWMVSQQLRLNKLDWVAIASLPLYVCG